MILITPPTEYQYLHKNKYGCYLRSYKRSFVFTISQQVARVKMPHCVLLATVKECLKIKEDWWQMSKINCISPSVSVGCFFFLNIFLTVDTFSRLSLLSNGSTTFIPLNIPQKTCYPNMSVSLIRDYLSFRPRCKPHIYVRKKSKLKEKCRTGCVCLALNC